MNWHKKREKSGTQTTSSASHSAGLPEKVATHATAGQVSRGRAVWVIRVIFLVFLLAVAVALGISTHHIITKIEDDLGQKQYEALVGRSIDLALELALRRRAGVNSMTQVASAAFPMASQWPNVAIPAFETIAADLINDSGNIKLAFYPLVQPEAQGTDEQSSFENFAYNYYYNVRNPPYPEDVASHNFGRGIWSQTTWRSRDVTGDTLSWDSPHKELFPEFQVSDDGEQARNSLMFNAHQDPLKGQPLDEVIDCSQERKEKRDTSKDCGAATNIFPWNRNSFLVQPIYPAHDNLEVSSYYYMCRLRVDSRVLIPIFPLTDDRSDNVPVLLGPYVGENVSRHVHTRTLCCVGVRR